MIFSEKTGTFILMFRHTLADDSGQTKFMINLLLPHIMKYFPLCCQVLMWNNLIVVRQEYQQLVLKIFLLSSVHDVMP